MLTQEEISLTKKIGRRLHAIREAQGLFLSELSEKTGGILSKPPISNQVQRLRRMGIEDAVELAAAFGTVSATYLLCLDDDGFLPDNELRLVRHYRATDQRGRATIMRVAELQSFKEKPMPLPYYRAVG